MDLVLSNKINSELIPNSSSAIYVLMCCYPVSITFQLTFMASINWIIFLGNISRAGSNINHLPKRPTEPTPTERSF